MTSASDTPPVRPALEKLDRDQTVMLEAVTDGFTSTRALIEWLQDVAICTLGKIESDVLEALATHPPLVTALLDTSTRAAYLDRRNMDRELRGGISNEAAKRARQHVRASLLLEPCGEAVRELRWRAVERHEAEGGDDRPAPGNYDVGSQPDVAMPPGLSKLDARQEDALGDLLDGFADADAVIEWAKSLNLATMGYLEPAFGRMVFENRTVRGVLLDEIDGAQYARERMAALKRLPAFNTAAAQTAERAGERAPEAESRTDAKPTEVF